jgi:voltage-gated potassium channel
MGGTVPTTGDAVREGGDDPHVIRNEFRELMTWSDRHKRLFSRLLFVLVLTAIVDVVGTIAEYLFERGATGTDIHSIGDALFFTTVQLLTVSSQIKNPLTAGGRVVDVVLELWAVIVVAGSAGAVASFFQAADRRRAEPQHGERR